MKKLLFMLVAAFISTATSAQIVMSRSVYKQKKPYKANFYIKAGIGTEGALGMESHLYSYNYGLIVEGKVNTVSHFAYNLSLGFDRTIGQQGAYWAVEVGGGSRGVAFEAKDVTIGGTPVSNVEFNDPNCSAFLIHLMPQFGWKFQVSDNIKIDTHIGAFAGISLPINEIHSIEYINSTGALGNTPLHSNVIDYWGDYEDMFDVGAQIGIGLWIDRFNIDLSYRQGFFEMLEGPDGMANKLFLSIGYAIPLHK
ncbi:MAG: PorT family protein [Bacteroidaceae bacterium]|nr:PorT family protein [Bacteroidaceae bacterium]